jgi:hypothetical protein
VSGTLVSITLGWLAPSDYGGCPLIGYRLFRDTGAGGSISTEVDNALVANQLNLNEYEELLGMHIGFRFMLRTLKDLQSVI